MRKPNYEALTLSVVQEAKPAPREQPKGDTLREISAQTLVYLSVEADRAIARYALEKSTHRNKCKKHDIFLEAIQEWLDAHGINVKARAK